MFLTASTSLADSQKHRDAVVAELRRDPVPAPAVPGVSELEEEKNARIGALSAALAGRLAWDRVLREVSLVLPDDVWLSSLSATAPVGASASTVAAGFSINGQTYSHDGVARLLARLAIVPHLSNVQLLHSSVAISESGREGGRVLDRRQREGRGSSLMRREAFRSRHRGRRGRAAGVRAGRLLPARSLRRRARPPTSRSRPRPRSSRSTSTAQPRPRPRRLRRSGSPSCSG